jgi:hypothetical protein
MIYAYVAAAILLVSSYAGTYLYGRSAGADSVRLEWEQANSVQRAREAATANEAAIRLEGSREKTRIVYRTITQSVDKYIDRVELRNVCLDPFGVCLANAAIGGTDAAACGTARPVPTSREAGGRDRGLALALDRGSLGALPRLPGEAGGAGGGG